MDLMESISFHMYRPVLRAVGYVAGEPMVIKKAVCMHEEDAGTLWKHTEYRTGHSEVRRSRRLVLSFIATIANYEYGFYWYFYQVSRPLYIRSKLEGHQIR